MALDNEQFTQERLRKIDGKGREYTVEYKTIEGGVCAAKGFMANGLNCGLNPVKEKNDLGVAIQSKNVMQQLFIRRIKSKVHRFL